MLYLYDFLKKSKNIILSIYNQNIEYIYRKLHLLKHLFLSIRPLTYRSYAISYKWFFIGACII